MRTIQTQAQQWAWKMAGVSRPEDARDQFYDESTTSIQPPFDAKWYHLSPHKLSAETVLAPRSGHSPWQQFYKDEGIGKSRQDWVWMEHSPDTARQWAGEFPRVNEDSPLYLYQIEPHEGPYAWNGTGDVGWVAPSATVKNLVGVDTGLGMSEPGQMEFYDNSDWWRHPRVSRRHT